MVIQTYKALARISCQSAILQPTLLCKVGLSSIRYSHSIQQSSFHTKSIKSKDDASIAKIADHPTKTVEHTIVPSHSDASVPKYGKEYIWGHPIYSKEQIAAVKIAHRNAETLSDKLALWGIKMTRSLFDLVTGYKHGDGKKSMTEENWLTRILFLESIAGVPGMVGGMVRHLNSLRRLKMDQGWLETLLEESENERMHLLTFLAVKNPGWFMRLMIVMAQGVYCNFFFFSYLFAPRVCHRFVGYLEEEAVITYTKCLEDLDAGKLPKWSKMAAPEIAINYWNLESNASLRDVISVVRADESVHRHVNHTLANLKQDDPNPFISNPDKTKMDLGSDMVGTDRKEIFGLKE